ncbi:hypothetical protein AB82_4812 [Escherichia coli 2-005-03_S3_C1]|nr:hypothetical protein AB82_4812 [Escherichia coli 2-005-03_S3_C1]
MKEKRNDAELGIRQIKGRLNVVCDNAKNCSVFCVLCCRIFFMGGYA